MGLRNFIDEFTRQKFLDCTQSFEIRSGANAVSRDEKFCEKI